MKTIILILLIPTACGKPGDNDRCRSAEEAQMVCQVDYAEAYQAFTIPDYIKSQCKNHYPAPGCYYDSNKRHNW